VVQQRSTLAPRATTSTTPLHTIVQHLTANIQLLYLIVDLQLDHQSQSTTHNTHQHGFSPDTYEYEDQIFDSFPDFKTATANWAIAGKFATKMKKSDKYVQREASV
jgi:hypothetical protein